jgi:hypothetical protein
MEQEFRWLKTAKLLKNDEEGLSVVCSSGLLSPFRSDELSRKSRPIDPVDVILKIALPQGAILSCPNGSDGQGGTCRRKRRLDE